MVGARALVMFKDEAKKRQQGGRGGVLLPPNFAEARGEAREKAAELVNVSHGSVQAAANVLAAGTPALIAAVDQGHRRAAQAFVFAEVS